jgi:hypothetical protein
MAEAQTQDPFNLSLTGEGITVERNVSAALARRILALVLGGPAAPPQDGGDSSETEGDDDVDLAPAPPKAGNKDPKAFLGSKKPTMDIEKVACLAYVLTHHRGMERFKTKDLTKAATDARTSPFSNPTQAAKNAARAQYLASAGKGFWLLTSFGEEIVDALPNREKVKTVQENAPRRRRRNNKKAKA